MSPREGFNKPSNGNGGVAPFKGVPVKKNTLYKVVSASMEYNVQLDKFQTFGGGLFVG